jgi:hypothetical protein
MFSEPLLAYPAEIHAPSSRHPRDDAYRDQHDADADNEEHVVVPQQAAYSNLDTGPADRLCGCAQVAGCELPECPGDLL